MAEGGSSTKAGWARKALVAVVSDSSEGPRTVTRYFCHFCHLGSGALFTRKGVGLEDDKNDKIPKKAFKSELTK